MTCRKIIKGKPYQSERVIYEHPELVTLKQARIHDVEAWWVYVWSQDDQAPNRSNMIGGPFRSMAMAERFWKLVRDGDWHAGLSISVEIRVADNLYTVRDIDTGNSAYQGSNFDDMCQAVRRYNNSLYPYVRDRQWEEGSVVPVVDEEYIKEVLKENQILMQTNARLAERLEQLLNANDAMRGKHRKRVVQIRRKADGGD